MATPTWKRYENRAAAFFRKLGFEVETGAKLPGPRAVYAVDLVARRSA